MAQVNRMNGGIKVHDLKYKRKDLRPWHWEKAWIQLGVVIAWSNHLWMQSNLSHLLHHVNWDPMLPKFKEPFETIKLSKETKFIEIHYIASILFRRMDDVIKVPNMHHDFRIEENKLKISSLVLYLDLK